MNIKELRQHLHGLKQQGREVLETAKAAGRDLTEVEESRLETLESQIEDANTAITAEEAKMDRERAFEIDASATISGGRDRAEDDPTRGFANFGEFAIAVYQGARAGGVVDERLRIGAAPTTYGGEGTGADGGFLVPAEFSNRIYQHALEEDSFLPMTDNVNVAGNGMSFPADETTPWGSSGIRAYWEGEAAQATQTKPSLKRKELRLHKLFALVPLTEELLADASAISGYVEGQAARSVRWKTNDAFVNGTGAGQPEGFANAGSIVSQAKVGSQTADTINAANVTAMYSRQLNPTRAVWLVHHDAWQQLPQMTIGDQPVFMPPGGLVSSPAGLLFGRPVIITDTCQTLGDLGDIYFVDWMGYVTITKAAGLATATSMHLWFDYDTTAFRVTFRVDGQSWAASAVSPANGSSTRSCFVSLAARA